MTNPPWEGDGRPPDAPVSMTLPYAVAKRVLKAIVTDAHQAHRSGKDSNGVRSLAAASETIGDAIGAPAHRRFRVPERTYTAVIAASREEYDRWVGYDRVEDPIFVDSVEDALANTYTSYVAVGTAYRRPDFQEIFAAVKSRTFPRGRL